MPTCLKSFVYFPLMGSLIMGVGFFVCYGIAVSLNHVGKPPQWPFVSDTGANQPESGIFTLLLTWTAFLFLVAIYSYYRYVIQCDSQSKCNKAAMIAGTITSFGITMVGAFQWTVAMVPHLVGALLAFVGAQVYSWIIIYISWKQLAGKIHNKTIVYVRVFIAIVEIVTFILVLVATVLNRTNPKYYNLATISEWVLIYSAIIFVATLAHDLKQISGADIYLKTDNCTSPPLTSRPSQFAYQATSLRNTVP